MNQREARRLVTKRVAAAVRALDEFDDFSPDDRHRMCAARDALAVELETRAGVSHGPPPPDPNQCALMTIENVRNA